MKAIEKDNLVRFMDAFVDKLDLGKLNFTKLDYLPIDGKEFQTTKVKKVDGMPSFDLKVFLKLYLYGYLNCIRSSRKLEKECIRNIELHWLLGKLQPNHHSIADFRKVYPIAMKSTFKFFVLFCKNIEPRAAYFGQIIQLLDFECPNEEDRSRLEYSFLIETKKTSY